MFSESIHNLVIRYFHTILAHTLFGKEEKITSVSRDELFIVTFILENLDRISRET